MAKNLPMIAAEANSSNQLKTCEHFELLGVSAAIHPDRDDDDLIHCLICNLSFRIAVEGPSLVVTEVLPYAHGK